LNDASRIEEAGPRRWRCFAGASIEQRSTLPWRVSLECDAHPARVTSWPRWPCHLKRPISKHTSAIEDDNYRFRFAKAQNLGLGFLPWIKGIDFFENCVYESLTDLPSFLYSLFGPGLQEFN